MNPERQPLGFGNQEVPGDLSKSSYRVVVRLESTRNRVRNRWKMK